MSGMQTHDEGSPLLLSFDDPKKPIHEKDESLNGDDSADEEESDDENFLMNELLKDPFRSTFPSSLSEKYAHMLWGTLPTSTLQSLTTSQTQGSALNLAPLPFESVLREALSRKHTQQPEGLKVQTVKSGVSSLPISATDEVFEEIDEWDDEIDVNDRDVCNEINTIAGEYYSFDENNPSLNMAPRNVHLDSESYCFVIKKGRCVEQNVNSIDIQFDSDEEEEDEEDDSTKPTIFQKSDPYGLPAQSTIELLGDGFAEQSLSQTLPLPARNSTLLDVDHYNLSLGTQAVKVHSQVRQFTIKHSRPAAKLEVFNTYSNKEELKDFHRPKLDVSKLKNRTLTVFSTQKFSDPQRMFTLTSEDSPQKLNLLSGVSGRMLFVEYAQQYPPVIQEVGMSSGLRNYVSFKCTEGYDVFADGDVYVLDEKTESPFKVEIPPVVRSLENNLFRCPIAEHTHHPSSNNSLSNNNNQSHNNISSSSDTNSSEDQNEFVDFFLIHNHNLDSLFSDENESTNTSFDEINSSVISFTASTPRKGIGTQKGDGKRGHTNNHSHSVFLLRQWDTLFLAGRLHFHLADGESAPHSSAHINTGTKNPNAPQNAVASHSNTSSAYAIPEPKSFQAKQLQNERIDAILSSFFKHKSMVDFQSILNELPYPRDYLRTQLKHLHLVQQDKYWLCTEESKLVTISPEKLCVHESLLWGMYQSISLGLKHFFSPQTIALARELLKYFQELDFPNIDTYARDLDRLEEIAYSLPWGTTQRRDLAKANRDKKNRGKKETFDYRVFSMTILYQICQTLGINASTGMMRWKLVKLIKDKCNDLVKEGKAPDLAEQFPDFKKLVREQKGPHESQIRARQRAELFEKEHNFISGQSGTSSLEEIELAMLNEIKESKAADENEEELESQRRGKHKSGKTRVTLAEGSPVFIELATAKKIEKKVAKLRNTDKVLDSIPPEAFLLNMTPLNYSHAHSAAPCDGYRYSSKAKRSRMSSLSPSHGSPDSDDGRSHTPTPHPKRAQLKRMKEFLRQKVTVLLSQQLFAAFFEPVSKEIVPDYPLYVKSSMSLSTISKRCKESKIKTRAEFMQAIDLILENCLSYNSENGGKFKTVDLIPKAYLLRDFAFALLYSPESDIEINAIEEVIVETQKAVDERKKKDEMASIDRKGFESDFSTKSSFSFGSSKSPPKIRIPKNTITLPIPQCEKEDKQNETDLSFSKMTEKEKEKEQEQEQFISFDIRSLFSQCPMNALEYGFIHAIEKTTHASQDPYNHLPGDNIHEPEESAFNSKRINERGRFSLAFNFPLNSVPSRFVCFATNAGPFISPSSKKRSVVNLIEESVYNFPPIQTQTLTLTQTQPQTPKQPQTQIQQVAVSLIYRPRFVCISPIPPKHANTVSLGTPFAIKREREQDYSEKPKRMKIDEQRTPFTTRTNTSYLTNTTMSSVDEFGNRMNELSTSFQTAHSPALPAPIPLTKPIDNISVPNISVSVGPIISPANLSAFSPSTTPGTQKKRLKFTVRK